MFGSVKVGSRDVSDRGLLREVLAEQTVGVFVGWPLPGAARVAEEHGYAGGLGERGVGGEFVALVPGECATNRPVHGGEDEVELHGDVVGGDSVDEVDEERVATDTLDECADRSLVSGAEDEVALPVAGLTAIRSASGPFGDRDHVRVVSALVAVASLPAWRSASFAALA